MVDEKTQAKKAEDEETPQKEDVEIVEEAKEEPEIIEEEEEEEGYKPKAKPELTKEEKVSMHTRSAKKRKAPKFRRQEWFRYGRLDERWRRPRGIQSKARRNYKYRTSNVSKGFRGPKLVRGRHPSGFEEVLVHNPGDLEGLDPKRQAIRIGHTVGTRKRIAIKEKADDIGLRILNWGS